MLQINANLSSELPVAQISAI